MADETPSHRAAAAPTVPGGTRYSNRQDAERAAAAAPADHVGEVVEEPSDGTFAVRWSAIADLQIVQIKPLAFQDPPLPGPAIEVASATLTEES